MTECRPSLNTNTPGQWLDLTDHEKLYIILQAKPNKGNEGIQDIKSSEDLAVELAAAMDKDLDDEVSLPRPPFLTEVFPTGVPHMRYRRIVTLANENQVSKVARGLWQNSRLVWKKLTTNRRVRFGVWAAGAEEDHQRAPREPVMDGQAPITVLFGLSEATVHKYAALFGLFTTVSTRGASHILGRTKYVVTYGRKERAFISHDVTLDSTLGK